MVGVDPVFKGLAAYSGEVDDFAATIEAVPDNWLHLTLKTCSAVVYCAEIGRATRYQKVKGLDASNNQASDPPASEVISHKYHMVNRQPLQK